MAKKKGFEDFPDQPTDLSDFPDQSERGDLAKVWDWANTPLITAPSRWGKGITESIAPSPVSERTALDPGKAFQHQLKEFLAGIPQGIGDVISGFTSPLNLVTGAAFGGAGTAARGGLGLTSKVIPRAAAMFTPKPQVARGLQNIGRALSVPIVGHGITETFGPDKTWGERAFGVIEMGGGGLGIKTPRFPVSRTTVGTTGKPRTPVTPESVRRAKNVIETNQGNLKRIAGMTDDEIVSYAEQVNPEWKPTLEEPVKPGKGGKGEPPKVTVEEEAPKVVLSSDGRLINAETGEVLGVVPGAVEPPTKPPVKPPVATAPPKTGEVLPPNVPPTSDVIPPPTTPPPDVMPPASPEFTASVNAPDVSTQYPLTGDFIQQQHLRAWLNSSDKEIKEVAESLIRRRTDQPDMPVQPGEDLILAEYERRGLKPESVAEQLMTQHGEEYDPFAVTTKTEPVTSRTEPVTAEFAFMQDDFKGGEIPMYHIRGGPSDRSTVSAEALKQMGIPIPPVTNAQMAHPPKPIGGKILPTQRAADQHVVLEEQVRAREAQQLLDRMEAEGLLKKPGVEEEVNQALQQAPEDIEPQFSRAYDPRVGSDSRGNFETFIKSSSTEELVRTRQQLNDDLQRWSQEQTGSARRRVALTKSKLQALDDEIYQREIEPQFAKVAEGKAKIDVNVKRSAQELTTGYSRALPAIMVREGVQNAIDAIHITPNRIGQITLKIGDDFLEVGDDGIGMSPDELYTVYTNLHETGKLSDTGAAGGKGVGKASYMLGGSHFKVITVKDINGQKIRSTFEGTPDDLLAGFDIKSHPVSPETRTGTWFRTDLPNYQAGTMGSMLNDILEYSRDLDIAFKMDKFGTDQWTVETTKRRADDKSIFKDKLDNGNDEVEILLPKDTKFETRSSIKVKYLNKGFYQYDDYMYLNESVNGIPEHIIVDINPLVEEGSPNYPFPVQRESIKSGLKSEIEAKILEELINPFKDKRKVDLQKLWDSMTPVVSTKTGRDVVFYDPGNRLTPDELMDLQTSPLVSQISENIDTLVNDILQTIGNPAWTDKVRRVGLILSEPGFYGVHIPHPSSSVPQSAILVNPFAHFENLLGGANSPVESALDIVVTALHEVAHVGVENPAKLPRITDADLNDPRVGRYLQTYMQQVMSQGGIDMGHGMPFVHRLGLVYAKYGTRKGLNAATTLQQIFENPVTGGYSTELQRIFQIYKDSRRRSATTEDILSPTGVKSEIKPGRENTVSRDTGSNGERVPPQSNRPPTISVREPTPAKIEMLKQLGYIPGGRGPDGYPVMKLGTPQEIASKGKLPKVLVPFKEDIQVTNPTQAVIKRLKEQGFKLTDLKADGTATFKYVKTEQPKKASVMRELFNLPRGLTTTADISAPLRQGLPLIATKSWWTSWDDMFRALGSEQAYQNVISDIEGKELFRPRFNPRTGTVEKSFAVEAGLKLSDLKALGSREESIMSTWVENIPGFGRIARGSNRAYTAFLNKLRADTFESLINDAIRMGLDPKKNMVLASEIADFVNTTTGRGPMKTALPTIGEGGKILSMKERDIERHAELLTNTLFSPRLVASRVRMLNPGTYIMASPFVRKQYLKALLSTAGAWSTVAGLAYGMGAEVSFDTNSADFGKIKFGNTRLDPAGGFQQYLVAISRFATGKHTSSASNREFELGEGFKAETRWSTAERFAVNKLHPVWKFGYDLFTASQYKPFNLFDRMAQLFVPLIVQDAIEIAQEDPTLLPLLAPVAAGMGTQTYEKGSSDAKFTPFLGVEDLDVTFGGGGYR